MQKSLKQEFTYIWSLIVENTPDIVVKSDVPPPKLVFSDGGGERTPSSRTQKRLLAYACHTMVERRVITTSVELWWDANDFGGDGLADAVVQPLRSGERCGVLPPHFSYGAGPLRLIPLVVCTNESVELG